MNLFIKNAIRTFAGSVGVLTALSAPVDMVRLELRDGHFMKPDGMPERFWGVNLVAAYPSHEEAEAIADNLASLGVNLVRPHHLMRASKDWVWRAPCAALVTYENDSRTPDAEAWDRFDYLNAALRKRGIRLVLSLHNSRKFLPGDAAIDPTGDAAEWAATMEELNGWSWQKAIDPVKLLPVVDRRARLVQKEFTKALLTHRNPYTGTTYGEDAQVLYLEVVNESSLEYALICGNRFPAFFERGLQDAWKQFAAGAGVANPGDLREVKGDEMLKLRAEFFRAHENAYYRDMRSFLRDLGAKVPMTCSNLWRGDDVLASNAEIGDVVEDHLYVDSLVVREAGDWQDAMVRTLVDGKPHFIGEFNHTEDPEKTRLYAYARPMLMLAAASYGAFHDLDGIIWFAYNHGDRNLGPDGWAKAEQRVPSLGDMAADGVMLDHMAACSALFRSGVIRKSVKPQIRAVDVPVNAPNYNALMNEVRHPPAGASSVHSYRKTFRRDGGDATEKDAEAASVSGAEIFVSDTGEIVRDVSKRQLSVVAPGAEAFSGFLADGFPKRFAHILCTDTNGFATIIAVAMDDQALRNSRRIRVSRTWMKEDGIDVKGLGISIKGLEASGDGGSWRMRVQRPRVAGEVLSDLIGSDYVTLKQHSDGTVVLPAGTWNQVEIVR